MKRSPEFTPGIYQYEFREDHIDLVEWSTPPTSTKQWVEVLPNENSLTSKYKTFYLEGTSNEDIRVVEVGDDVAFEWYSTNGSVDILALIFPAIIGIGILWLGTI